MENKKWLRILPYGIATAMVIVSLLSLGIALPSYYELNDDLMIQSILSGAFSGSPNAHTVYMNFPLTALLAGLYAIAPQISWYGILLQGCYAVGLFFILATLIAKVKKPENYLFTIVPVWLMFWAVSLDSYVVLQYTVASVALGGAGLFLFGVREPEETIAKTLKGNLVSVIMLVIAFLMRTQSFLLLLPFALVVVIWKCLEEQFCKKVLLKYAVLVGVTLASVGVLAGCNRLFYSGDWSAFQKANDARTEVYDFSGVLPYNDATSDFYAEQGLTKADVMMLEEYNILWVEGIDTDKLNAMASEAKRMNDSGKSAVAEFKHLIKTYYYELRYSDRYQLTFVATMITYLLLIGVIVAKKLWKFLTLPALMVIIRSAVWMYLLRAGRFPDRVEIALYMAELFVLAALLYSILNKNDGKQKWMIAGVSIIFTGVLFIFSVSQGILMQRDLTYQKLNCDDTAVAKSYFSGQPDHVYCIDVYSFVFEKGNVHVKGNENAFENYIVMGGWLYDSPIMQQKLEALGTQDAITELPSNDSWYFVILETRSEQTLIDYYNEQGTPIDMEEDSRLTLPSGKTMRIMKVAYQEAGDIDAVGN